MTMSGVALIQMLNLENWLAGARQFGWLTVVRLDGQFGS